MQRMGDPHDEPGRGTVRSCGLGCITAGPAPAILCQGVGVVENVEEQPRALQKVINGPTVELLSLLAQLRQSGVRLPNQLS